MELNCDCLFTKLAWFPTDFIALIQSKPIKHCSFDSNILRRNKPTKTPIYGLLFIARVHKFVYVVHLIQSKDNDSLYRSLKSGSINKYKFRTQTYEMNVDAPNHVDQYS